MFINDTLLLYLNRKLNKDLPAIVYLRYIEYITYILFSFIIQLIDKISNVTNASKKHFFKRKGQILWNKIERKQIFTLFLVYHSQGSLRVAFSKMNIY